MKYVVIIQARCGSSRLPNKVLKDVFGKTALERMIDRVKKSKKIDEIIIATTLNKEDIKIVNLISSLGIRVFAGSSNDVLDRYFQAAKLLNTENVIRLTSDCPLFDYEILDNAIKAFEKEHCDYLGMTSETFPDGLDLEIMKYEVLKRAHDEAVLLSEKEHVTLYIKNHRDLFKLYDYKYSGESMKAKRWTLDEAEDYEFVLKVYEHFLRNNMEYFTMADILDFLEKNPEIEKINSKFIRNEGLIKSLANDGIAEI